MDEDARSILGLPLGARSRQHLGREVHTHDARAAPRVLQSEISGPAAGVHHQALIESPAALHSRPPPAPIDAHREHAVKQVVAAGEARKHRTDLNGLGHGAAA